MTETPLPISPEEREHGTFGCQRAVLLIGRTVTSTSRVLEAARFFRDDLRIRLLFTVNAESKYSAGAQAALEEAGVEVIPWADVPDLDYALAITASENIDFTALKPSVPTVVLPHGVGFNKWVPDPKTGGTRLAGLPSTSALRDNRIRVVLGHPAQEQQLRQSCPEIVDRTAVIGDPTYDQLLASLPLQDRFRRKLGLDGRKLVLISSTWRSESALARWRTLPGELLAALPADEYQVAVVLHPNVWAWYGRKAVQTFFASAVDAGLLLLPPTRGWQAALVAAHVVLADHGSLGLYAAGLGKPLLLAAFGEESVAGTPPQVLRETADFLNPRHDLREQLDRCLTDHNPHRFAELTRSVFAHVGEAEERLRDLLYAEIGLPAPSTDVPLRRPLDPDVAATTVTSFHVHTEFADSDTLLLRRYPAAATPADAPADPPLPAERHLAVDEDEPDLRRALQAAVIVRRDSAPENDAWKWTDDALRRLSGARVSAAATPAGILIRVRNGPLVEATADDLDPMIAASAVYACVLAGSLHTRALRVWAGARTATLRITKIAE